MSAFRFFGFNIRLICLENGRETIYSDFRKWYFAFSFTQSLEYKYSFVTSSKIWTPDRLLCLQVSLGADCIVLDKKWFCRWAVGETSELLNCTTIQYSDDFIKNRLKDQGNRDVYLEHVLDSYFVKLFRESSGDTNIWESCYSFSWQWGSGWGKVGKSGELGCRNDLCRLWDVGMTYLDFTMSEWLMPT